jgi:prepilin-type N-terminal cleavage/methylation domain-containing protein/prepilin-type processing-associated H-X9-DG protein
VRRSGAAFTLVELLVVIAIISALAAMLFPAFAGAKASARSAVCMSQMRQVAAGTNLYLGDYDDKFMPISYQPATQATSRNDRTWVQLVLPYIRTFSVFRCPADLSSRPALDATFDQDLVPGDTASQYYSSSLRINQGLNYQYLSPVQKVNGLWAARPRVATEISNPAQTLMYLDSVWSRGANGEPVGGGSWLVTPPCRYYYQAYGMRSDSFTNGGIVDTAVFELSKGWSEEEEAPNKYGNAWPWHSGRMNMAKVDGSVRSISPQELTKGCQLQSEWQGRIDDPAAYMWDLR